MTRQTPFCRLRCCPAAREQQPARLVPLERELLYFWSEGRRTELATAHSSIYLAAGPPHGNAEQGLEHMVQIVFTKRIGYQINGSQTNVLDHPAAVTDAGEDDDPEARLSWRICCWVWRRSKPGHPRGRQILGGRNCPSRGCDYAAATDAQEVGKLDVPARGWQ
jgi:hypothetical protein